MGMDKFEAIKKWYSGKALAVVTDFVIPTLKEAESLGYWPKGVSRTVAAALNKQTVAGKFARANKAADELGYSNPLWHVNHGMMFGSIFAALRAPEAIENATMAQWVADFKPIAELVEMLDATRPKPVLLFETMSRTTLANVAVDMGVDISAVKYPEMEWKRVEKVDDKGKTYWTWEVEILWPEGTKHKTSQYARDRFSCCHACGHRIRNPYNWIPLLGETSDGPVSLWVGTDCAKNLFGCKISDTNFANPSE